MRSLNLRTLSALQWLGLFVAPAAWFAQHAIGQAIGQASCSSANTSWGVSNTAWQIGLLIGAGILILLSEAAAVGVYLATRESTYQDAPPAGRLQLIAIASMTTNLLYLAIILLDGIASIVARGCAQS